MVDSLIFIQIIHLIPFFIITESLNSTLMSGWEGINEYLSRSHIDSILREREIMESSLSSHHESLNDIRTVMIAGSSLDEKFIYKVKTWIFSVSSLYSQNI